MKGVEHCFCGERIRVPIQIECFPLCFTPEGVTLNEFRVMALAVMSVVVKSRPHGHYSCLNDKVSHSI